MSTLTLMAVGLALLSAALMTWQLTLAMTRALQRYRNYYVEGAKTGLEELFLFIEPAQLWTLAIVLAMTVGILGWLLTRLLPLAIVLSLLALRLPAWLLVQVRRRRAKRFEAQLPIALQSLACALRAGASFSTALQNLVALADAPLAQEFGLMLREQRLGVPLSQGLVRLEARVSSESLYLMSAALRIATLTGGNLASALEAIAEALLSRLQLQGRLRALSAQARMQAGVLTLLPGVLGVALYFLRPDSVALLWRTSVGWGVLTLMAVLLALGWMLIRRTLEIDR